MFVHRSFQMFSLPDRVVLQSTESDVSRRQWVAFDRAQFQVKLGDVRAPDLPDSGGVDCVLLVGVLRLTLGPYVIVGTKARAVGDICGAAVYALEDFRVEPLFAAGGRPAALDEVEYLRLVELVLRTPTTYFSYERDLTQSEQRLAALSEEQRAGSVWDRSDGRFFWNRYLLKDLTQDALARWIVPTVMGFFRSGSMLDGRAQFALISRRNTKRAGTRYFMRGIDNQGNVANNVETEQIVWTSGAVASHVQIRGSIPLFWSQQPNLKYKPKPRIAEGQRTESVAAFERHFKELGELYGSVIAVNLVDQKGSEFELEKEYGRLASASRSDVRYIGFDFHKECRKMQYENVELLMKQIREDLQSFGFFLGPSRAAGARQQTGTVRTNCIDNLDRTNVVQSKIARETLPRQLQAALGPAAASAAEAALSAADEALFMNTWADHADAISTQYAGTGALKTDYTRTGKRTMMGALNDGLNSAVRYIKNNFYDGDRQDAFDLFLGVHVIDPERPSRLRLRSSRLPYVLAVATVMCVVVGSLTYGADAVLPSASGPWSRAISVLSLLLGGYAGVRTAYYFGSKLVNRPMFRN